MNTYNLIYYEYTIQELDNHIANNDISEEDLYNISMYQTLSEEFIDKYSDMVDWSALITYQKLSYDFLEKNLYKYSLYIYQLEVFDIKDINIENKHHIKLLQQKYPNKYLIDKLNYELNRE